MLLSLNLHTVQEFNLLFLIWACQPNTILFSRTKNVSLLRTAYQPDELVVKFKLVVNGLTHFDPTGPSSEAKKPLMKVL